MALDSRQGRPGTWELDRAAFDSLLALLGTDRETASLEYERLRRRLVSFFAMHHHARAQDLADLAFDRLARKIMAGESIRSVPQYLSGIARVLLLEERNHLRKEAQVLRLNAAAPLPRNESAELEALENCFAALSQENQSLLYRYYSSESRARITARQNLAEEMGLHLNALRNRALRLRERLEECIRRHMDSDNQRDISGSDDSH
jgi:DNA-directed RNA polymerase specialized sigma24 family protein